MIRFGFFSKPKTKTKYNFIFLSVFRLGLFETNYFSSCTQPHFFAGKKVISLVFLTPQFDGNPLLAREKIRRKSYGNDLARENTHFRIQRLIDL